VKHDILIADDDEHLREMLELMFSDNFTIHFAETGQQTIDAILKNAFQFIILDIHLPGKSGIEICRELNAMELERQPQIVILSADSNEKTVREAYEQGVGDYICKPFNVTAFNERMLRFSRDIDKMRDLENKDGDVQTIAETVMKQAAAYGNGLELLGRLNNCRTPKTFANELLLFMHNQGFHTAIQLRSKTHTYSFDVDENSCSDIELQIFDLLKTHGRIYHFGKRSIFNDKHVSILVKNMPFTGTRSYDVLLDLLAKLIPAIDARFLSVCEHKVLLDTREALNVAMTSISENLQDFELEKRHMMEAIESKVSMGFHRLNLDEEQEAYFVDIIEKEIVQRETSEQLDKVQETIVHCVKALSEIEESQPQSPQDGYSSTDEIELFD